MKIFGRKRDEVSQFRMLHNEEFRGFHRSPNIVTVVKYTRLR